MASFRRATGKTATQFPNGQARCARRTSPRKLLIFDPVRDGGIDPEAALLVLLVVLEIALEPFHVAVALEGQNVGRNAVEEPAIMADDDRAAGEILQRLF